MSKHTPGPWKVDPSNSFEVVTNDRDLVAMTYDREYYGYYESITDEQKEANARLIAAAPELYEALCRMSYIFMQIVEAVEIDIKGTRFEVENKATGEKGSLSLREIFEAASKAIDKVHGETNE